MYFVYIGDRTVDFLLDDDGKPRITIIPEELVEKFVEQSESASDDMNRLMWLLCNYIFTNVVE